MSEKTELDLLKERADTMGISYHPNIGIDTLKERLEKKMGTKEEEAPEGETTPQRNARLRKEALKLVRIRLTCMNPSKKDWPGEIISVSNSAIGTVKKFIPFEGAEEGYHVPEVLLGVLEERVFQSFYTVKRGGRKVKKSKLVREFAIEKLPPLTVEELEKIADKQAADRHED